MIFAAYTAGIRVAKVYPRNVTTNSGYGVINYEKYGMVVCFHPEHPSEEIEGMKKESLFRHILRDVRRSFSSLKIVVEHVSTEYMAQWVKNGLRDFVGATLTPQHLFLTIDDVIGYSTRSGYKGEVHHMCKPTLKLEADREFLQKIVLTGDSQFFYGGDDAPHFRSNKEAARCNCGVFNTTVALPLLIDFFHKNKKINLLDNFLSGFGADSYDFPRNKEMITFERKSWTVPSEYPVPRTFQGISGQSIPSADSVVPMLAGEVLNWQIVS